MHPLTAFDIVVLLMVGLAAIGGLARGFVGEVVSLLAWVAAMIAVRFLYTPGKAIAAKLTGTESGGAILALAVIFLGTFILVRVGGAPLSRGAKSSVIGPIDRLLGFGFGAAKGVLGASLLFLLASMVFDTIDPGEPAPAWLREARTAPLLAAISKSAVDFVEERRRVPHDSAAADPAAPPAKPGQGYDAPSRNALDELLKKQAEKSPETPI